MVTVKKEANKFEHKFIGFHNQKEVVSYVAINKDYAEKVCK